jgi:hypothetical protein
MEESIMDRKCLTYLFAGMAWAGALYAQSPASYRVLLGVTDSQVTRWDGSIAVTGTAHYTLEGWRFEAGDQTDGKLFHLSTRANVTPGDPAIVANGLIVNADGVTDSAEFRFTTAQGDFRFTAAEVPYSNGIYKLGGRAYIDRIPQARRLAATPEEEDYPSLAAGRNGEAWLAYVQFHHNPDHIKLRRTLKEAPQDFSQFTAAPGGDQIWARKYANGAWGEPIAITKPGGDLYRTAIAVDGSGRAWVFWSENHGGNFDVFARAVDDAGAKEQVQISHEPGSDIDPVAATDSKGKVWVAWQGWRDGRAAIYAASQNGSGFSAPAKVSNSSRNEWNPAIAADGTGRVSVAWDSYRNGNYDVYARTWAASSWGAEIPIAASAAYEAYPSIAYDPSGRLWVAYEEGGRDWGKDFGADVTPGIALYQGRAIRLRALEPDGRLVALDATLDAALAGTATTRGDRIGSQSDSDSFNPNPRAAKQRLPDGGFPNPTRVARNTLPRLAVDASGRFWLAFRSPNPTMRSPIGTVWAEYLVSFDGKAWTKPIFLNHSDNLLDNRPALAAGAAGRLLIVNSSDGRRIWHGTQGASNPGNPDPNSTVDPFNNDLWSHEVDLGAANQSIPVIALGREARPEPPTVDGADAAGIRTLRDYRAGPEKNLHLVRGEFHRHSEISSDGGNDGTILDQWRYILDTADLDWVGCCDHDNGSGREYFWWLIQKQTDIFWAPGKFVPMFAYERSVQYPEGHRNVIFAQRGIRPLPRLPLSDENEEKHAPDTQMLYAYLKQFNGISASHTSGTGMGTDWRDNDPNGEPVVEIYQGIRQNYEMADAPRANSEKDSIGGWRPKGYVNIALDKGYRLGFESSSDHISTHISYCILLTKDLSREAVLEAFQKRHVYAATDNILADVESGSHLMGDEFTTSDTPSLKVKLKGTSKFAKVVIVKDGKYVYSTAPNAQSVDFSWRDNEPSGKTSYYYVRGEQDNGEIVWASPMWIDYKAK